MKRLLGCFVVGSLLVWMAAPANAQLPGATIGFKAGLNVADLSGEEDGVDLDLPSRTALAVGAAIGINVSPVFAFQPEILYSQKGSSDDGGTLAINYLEVPILAKFSVPTPSNVRPVFVIGPVVSFEVGCNLSNGGSISCDDAGLDARKKTDIGILGGAGLEIDVGAVVLTFDGRYNYGLVNIDDSGADNTSVKNRTVTGLVGVAFKLPS